MQRTTQNTPFEEQRRLAHSTWIGADAKKFRAQFRAVVYALVDVQAEEKARQGTSTAKSTTSSKSAKRPAPDANPDSGILSREEEEVWSLNLTRWCEPHYTLRIEESHIFIAIFNAISDALKRDTLFLSSPAHGLAQPMRMLDETCDISPDTVSALSSNNFTPSHINLLSYVLAIFRRSLVRGTGIRRSHPTSALFSSAWKEAIGH
jgi:hypothetical protein